MMKVLVFLGLVAVALCEPTNYVGDKVFRMWPLSDTHLSFIKELESKVKQVDFWSPENAEVVTLFSEVDVRIPAAHVDMVLVMLQQSGMEYQVLIDDVQAAVRQQFDSDRKTRAHSYIKYNSWADIESWVSSITAGNPALISQSTLGKSFEGRTMHLLKIGKNTGATKPAIFMDCGIHAREWISPAFCQWFVQEAVTTYGSNSQMTSLLDTMDIFVLPVFNVDGYDYTWKSDRMWRKTRSRRSGSTCIGVDPNRNFDAGWCTVGASSYPCSDTYCGPTVESEIEVQNVANFIRKNKSIIKAYLTIHSYSQLLLFPYSYTYSEAKDHAELMAVATSASAALQSLHGTRYTSGPGAATI
ncbi:carboxypeptidase B, partial [Clarias magur]